VTGCNVRDGSSAKRCWCKKKIFVKVQRRVQAALFNPNTAGADYSEARYAGRFQSNAYFLEDNSPKIAGSTGKLEVKGPGRFGAVVHARKDFNKMRKQNDTAAYLRDRVSVRHIVDNIFESENDRFRFDQARSLPVSM